MQYFINHAAIERAATEVFSGTRARYYLYAVIALGVAAAAGPALSAIWCGLALLVDEGCRMFAPRLARLVPRYQNHGRLLLDGTASASLAVAPALAWFAQGPNSGVVAVAVLGALLVHSSYNARRGRVYAVMTAAPYIVLGLAFLGDAVGAGAGASALTAALALLYVWGASLHHAHRAAHARVQDAEWLRQLNMSFTDANAAAWEIDFVRQRLIGADRLSALVGRPVTFADVVEHGCFAAPEDRALVKSAFAPAPGAVRRVALAHSVLRADGSRMRVRHQAFVRTTPDGAPVRLTCVTRHGDSATSEQTMPRDAINDATAALAAQTEALKTLRNELSLPVEPAPPLATLSAGLAQVLRTLAEGGVELERGVDDLAHARHAAESANLAKSQFLANMSHELRTPLNAIIGYAEMLQEDAQDSGDTATVQDLSRILGAAKHLLSLINEILDLSKIEAGRMDVSVTAFDPHELLEDLIATVRPTAEQNGDVITLRESGAQALANTDSMKLGQCVLNLLSNAAKFTKNGKIDVLVERRELNGVMQLFVSVSDTGIGMSSEHMARLFQPFVQADPTITQQYGGTGLGLTITRRLAQLLGGDVSVESALGQGSIFTLHVPIDFADASKALGAAAQVDAVQGAEDAPLVIVIEDEPDARELAARALTRAGFAVQGVGGGEAGLALARAKAPALVLLDIFLPDRSGWRVLQSLKHDPKTQDIPVVVLSVNEDRGHALALGAAEHIVKPAERDVLAATVMRYARKRNENAAAGPGAIVTPLAHKQAG
ncbi:MAG: response regulator [Caulobacterales bacterium]|nr:response regulator [Caulobacterales bacterium]